MVVVVVDDRAVVRFVGASWWRTDTPPSTVDSPPIPSRCHNNNTNNDYPPPLLLLLSLSLSLSKLMFAGRNVWMSPSGVHSVLLGAGERSMALIVQSSLDTHTTSESLNKDVTRR